MVVASSTTVDNLSATNTLNTNITDDVATAAPVYPTFVTGTTGNLAQRVASSRLSFIPSTGALTAGSFVGPLSGNANTATTATNTTITNDIATAAVTYPTFVTNTTGNLEQRTSSTRLNFVPLTGVLTANAFTSTVPTGVAPLVVASTTTVANLGATNTLNTNITEDVATTAPVFPTFVTASSGNQNQRVASSRLSFIPSTGALTASSFVGPLNGNATSATSAVNATNSANSFITDDITTATVAYPVFVNGTPGNQPLRTGTTNISYRPATGILTAKGFNGPLVGNVTGTSTASLDAENTVNMRITDDVISSTPVYPTFVTGTSGPLPPKVSSGKLSFIPSLGELTATTFRGAVIGNSSSATTVTGNVAAVNGGTGQASYSPGDLLYASTSTALSRLAIGAPNTVLRVSAGNVPTWSTAGAGTVVNVTGTTNRIIVTDPLVSPSVDISPAYIGQTSITTLGTIGTGVWSGTPVTTSFGGTGLNTLPVGRLMVGNGTGNVGNVDGDVAGLVLTSNGAGFAPTFKSPGAGDMVTTVAQTVIGAKTFGQAGNVGKLILAGNISGTTILNGPATGTSGTVVLPQTGTLVTQDGIETLTNKNLVSPTMSNPTIGAATGTQLVLNSGTPLITTNQTGTGNIVMSNTPTISTPTFTGTVTASTISASGAITATGGFIGTSTNTSNVGALTAAAVETGVNLASSASITANNTLVRRNATGDFTAGTITAALAGNASSATQLANSRDIFGFAFNGTLPLTGIIAGTYGGTGINNGNRTISIAGNLITSGANQLTFTTTNTTNVQLPTSGTLYGTQTGSFASAALITSLTDAIGTGRTVFNTAPNLIRPVVSSLLADGAFLSTKGTVGTNVDATSTVSGTNLAGTVTVVISGGIGAANNKLIEVVYSTPFPVGSYPVLYPANSKAAELSSTSQVFATGSTDKFEITSGSVGLPIATYIWNYQVIGR